MKLYIVYYGCRYEGAGIIGIYLNEKNAIKASMRKVYQLLRHDAKKVENKWEWFDGYELVAIKEHLITDMQDTAGESTLPAFVRYKDYLETIPAKELENMRRQSINRRNMIDKLKKLRRGDS